MEKTVICVRCGNKFPELRKQLFGYDFCVNCSTVEPKVGITEVFGEGDHTWNDIVIVDRGEAIALDRKVRDFRKNIKVDIPEDFETEGEDIRSRTKRIVEDLDIELDGSEEEEDGREPYPLEEVEELPEEEIEELLRNFDEED